VSDIEDRTKQIEIEAQRVAAQLQAEVKEAPKWKLIGFAVAVLCVLGYLWWSFAHSSSPPSGAVIPLAPAVTAQKVEGPTMKVPLRIVPAAAASKKFPQIGTISPGKPVIDTGKIPTAENGGSTITFMNISTGTASTVFIPAAAPWFALEDKNAVGMAYLWTTRGPAGAAYYRRDIFRVKNFHAGVLAGVLTVEGRMGVGAGVTGEVRF